MYWHIATFWKLYHVASSECSWIGWYQKLVSNLRSNVPAKCQKYIIPPGGNEFHIFHRKLLLCWLPNTNEIDIKNMSNANLKLAYPTRAIFHWLALILPVFALGPQTFMLGRQDFALGPQGFMLPFWISTCWYWQREGLALGVLPNANSKKSGFALR